MKLRVLAVTAAALAILITGAVPMHAQAPSAHGVNPWIQKVTCPPFTQGYWKNHQGVWRDGSGLTLGTNFYTNAQLESILQTPVHGDASVELAHQLIGALLNILNGTDPTLVQATLNDANGLIGSGLIPEGISPSSPTGQQMESDASILDEFNNGDITDACGIQPS